MDRVFTYPGQIPLETDPLNTNRWSMEGLGRFIDAVLGTTTLVNGLVVAPNGPPALNVVVGNGEVYSLQNLDSSPYSSLPADTNANHQIIKQGILRDPVTLATAAPGTGGFSINYLIQVAFQETDGGATVLPYYNASNPAVAWSGPANSGNPNFTVRQDQAIVSVKAGTAAATGTQTTPAPDAGNVGLAVVTVANGQASVGAGNIALYSPTSYISETLTQKISQTTADLRYLQIVASQNNSARFFGTAGGGPTAYTGSLTPTKLSLVDGTVVYGDFTATNSGVGPTFNLDTLGAKVIFQPDGTTQLPANTLPLNAELMYRTAINSGAGGWILLGLPGAASTTQSGLSRYATTTEVTQTPTLATAAVTPNALTAALQQASGLPGASGLVITNNGTTPNTKIDVTADFAVLVDSSGRSFGAAFPTATINLATNGALGLDTGSVTASTWLHIYFAAKPDGTKTAFASLSATAPTMPSGYTFAFRAGAMRVDSGSILMRTLQVGNETAYKVTSTSTNTTALPALISGGIVNSQSRTSFSLATIVPPTAKKVTALISNDGSATSQIALSPSGDTGYSVLGAGAGTNPQPITTLSAGSNNGVILGTLIFETAQTLFYSSGGAALAHCSAQVYGWTDKVSAS